MPSFELWIGWKFYCARMSATCGCKTAADSSENQSVACEDDTAADEDGFGDPQSQQKFGVGGINRPVDKTQNKYYGYHPLHLAADKGFFVSSRQQYKIPFKLFLWL